MTFRVESMVKRQRWGLIFSVAPCSISSDCERVAVRINSKVITEMELEMNLLTVLEYVFKTINFIL